MNISVIGSGYVGLVAGACFADTGNKVFCVDHDSKKIEALKKGVIPIYEPGLETLVQRGVKEERLFFTTSTAEAVAKSEVVFLAVGTPALPSGEPDLRYLKSASEEVARSLAGPCLIVNKSTVPIGAHRVVADWMRPLTRHRFEVVSNPEFLKEGSALDDFLKPDRVVIGAETEEGFKKMAEIYAPFVRQGNPIIQMDPLSAEMTKYACNSYLATRISFMNELSVLCDNLGGDIDLIRKGMSTDSRIGKHFLYAGTGYGGSCFPKDIKALLNTAKQVDIPLRIINSAEEANEIQKQRLFQKVQKHFSGNLKGRTFALWGLSFKPNTDDMRDAPSLVILQELLKSGARAQVFDPVAMENAKAILGTSSNEKINYCKTPYQAIEGADALLLVTEWNEFRHPDFALVKSKLKNPVIFDGRNLYDPKKIKALGFEYYGIGRRS